LAELALEAASRDPDMRVPLHPPITCAPGAWPTTPSRWPVGKGYSPHPRRASHHHRESPAGRCHARAVRL